MERPRPVILQSELRSEHGGASHARERAGRAGLKGEAITLIRQPREAGPLADWIRPPLCHSGPNVKYAAGRVSLPGS